MNNENADSTEIKIDISEDRQSATLIISNNDEHIHLVAMNTHSVDQLISALGTTRHQMQDPVPLNMKEGIHSLSDFNPRWYVLPDNENKYATFWIRHPSFGWTGYGFPRHESGNIAKWLRKVTTISCTRDTQSSGASSFGGDSFLLTTEGLGYYYYGKGETRIGPNPFEQIEFDSDRAAGIVAGSIAERRLEQAIRAKLRRDQPKVSEKLFRPSGALGAFSTKIDLAYLMGLLSEEAYRDLSNLKNIRNDFAHSLETDGFDIPTIRDRCKNLTLIEKHIGPVPDLESNVNQPNKLEWYMGLPDYKEKLDDPRFRYIMTAQFISNSLGQGADQPDRHTPFI